MASRSRRHGVVATFAAASALTYRSLSWVCPSASSPTMVGTASTRDVESAIIPRSRGRGHLRSRHRPRVTSQRQLPSDDKAVSAPSAKNANWRDTPSWDSFPLRFTYAFSGGITAHERARGFKTEPIDAIRLTTFFLLHGVAILWGPATFTWANFSLAIAGFFVLQTLGMSVSYHRQLSHCSFRCPKPLEYFFAWCGVLCLQGNPIWWARNHTWHHRFSDTPLDPHTPREGLWTAHVGWFFEKLRTGSKVPKAIMDAHTNATEDPEDIGGWQSRPWFYKESPKFYDWLRKSYYFWQLAQVSVLYALGGVGVVVWGFVIRNLLILHGVAAVNSIGHVWGDQPFNSRDDSKNNALVALVSSGDGYHNNHHAFPKAAQHGLLPGQPDLSYAVIAALERFGLAWDVNRPSQTSLALKRIAGPQTS